MALTPDDVVTKVFPHVRGFKEGFDPDEVDDFLDEIVIEWRKTLEENAELKKKLAAYESGEQAPAAAEAPAAEEAPLVEPAPVAEPVAAPAPEAAPAAQPSTATSAGIIELAQRLHDEHVAEGQAKRDELIAEGEAQAAKIVSEAEEKSRVELARLGKESSALESKIADLKEFESSYRAQLRGYIESQLKGLDESGSIADSAANGN